MSRRRRRARRDSRVVRLPLLGPPACGRRVERRVDSRDELGVPVAVLPREVVVDVRQLGVARVEELHELLVGVVVLLSLVEEVLPRHRVVVVVPLAQVPGQFSIQDVPKLVVTLPT